MFFFVEKENACIIFRQEKQYLQLVIMYTLSYHIMYKTLKSAESFCMECHIYDLEWIIHTNFEDIFMTNLTHTKVKLK